MSASAEGSPGLRDISGLHDRIYAGQRMLIALSALLALLVLLLVLGVVYQRFGERRDRIKHPPPGTILEVNGTPLHIRRAGTGSPSVVFEAGVAASSVSWAPVQDAISKITSTAAYDRAGFAWSGAAATALTADAMIEAFRELLKRASVRPPYVLTGHSFGCFLARLYADRWPEEVAGLVLVDPALVLEWGSPEPARLALLLRGIGLSRRGALLARIGFVRFSLWMLTRGVRSLPKLLSYLTSGRGHSVSSRLVGEVRKLPPELWPAVQSHWCKPESFESMARHLEEIPRTAAAVAGVKPLGRIPVTVISGGHLTREQLEEHAAVANSSLSGRHIVVEGTGHWVHLDNPSVVIEAIERMIRTDS